MPVKRRIVKARIGDVNEAEWAAMMDEPLPEDMNPFQRLDFEHYDAKKARVRALWVKHGDAALEAYIDQHPGWRSQMWWYWSAPELARRRVGGTGTYRSGDENLILGIPPNDFQFWKRDVDRNDLPRFEAQSAYLERHGLLTDDERQRLTSADFEPETITLDFGIFDKVGMEKYRAEIEQQFTDRRTAN